MSISNYSEVSDDGERYWSKKKCPFCSIDLNLLYEGKESEYLELNIQFCPKCGWWKITERSKSTYDGDEIMVIKGIVEVSSAVASLKELGLTDINTPLNYIRNYLVVDYDKRFKVNPKVFEDVVCSVFKDLGYNPITTAYSGDGGIDVILEKGKEIAGETAIVEAGSRIPRIFLDPADIPPNAAAVEAIEDADLICIGPGSVFTSRYSKSLGARYCSGN